MCVCVCVWVGVGGGGGGGGGKTMDNLMRSSLNLCDNKLIVPRLFP